MPNKVENKALWALLMRPVVALVAAGVCIACGLAAWQWAAPLDAPPLFPFSETWYARSLAAKTPADGIDDARSAIRLAPVRAENWMLLAYQYARADRGTSARVVAAVRQSYAVSALSYEVTPYRLSFVFKVWANLPADIQDDARAEARQYATTSKGLRFLEAAAPTISDARARLEFGLLALVAKDRLFAPRTQTP
jgi:hypothetical protein